MYEAILFPFSQSKIVTLSKTECHSYQILMEFTFSWLDGAHLAKELWHGSGTGFSLYFFHLKITSLAFI